MELKRGALTEDELIDIKKNLLLNLTIANLVMGASMYPQALSTIGGEALFVVVTTVLIAANILIPLTMLLSILGIIKFDIGIVIRKMRRKFLGKKASSRIPSRYVDVFFEILLLIIILSLLVCFIILLPRFNFNDYVAFGAAILALIVSLVSLWQSRQNHLGSLRATYISKQLEDLYMKLCMVAPDFWKLDFKDIEKYSYLAMGKLAEQIDENDKLIDKFIKCLKSPDEFTFREKNELYNKVNKAIEEDIKELKNQFRIQFI
jgi:hypothetical protein